MEQWKIDIADNMVSWDYARNLGPKYGIFIRCQTPEAQIKCLSALKKHIGALCADVKDNSPYSSGTHAIMVSVGSTQAEDQLKQNLNNLYTEVANWRNSQAKQEDEEEVVTKKIERQNYSALLILLALIAALAWVLLVWKPKK